jgi:hypothetical protein
VEFLESFPTRFVGAVATRPCRSRRYPGRQGRAGSRHQRARRSRLDTRDDPARLRMLTHQSAPAGANTFSSIDKYRQPPTPPSASGLTGDRGTSHRFELAAGRPIFGRKHGESYGRRKGTDQSRAIGRACVSRRCKKLVPLVKRCLTSPLCACRPSILRVGLNGGSANSATIWS